MTNYAQHVSAARVPQTEQARADQVPNNGGGWTFQLDMWKQLDRFLILGAEGGTYYATERVLTRDNAKNVAACLDADAAATVARIVEISEAGRAPKNDPALFALALATTHAKAREAAYAAIPRVARTGTHLLHLAAMLNELRGWGPGLRKAVGAWYLDKDPGALAYQMAKYQQRDGWSHRDVLRLIHPSAEDKPSHNALFRWATHGGLPGFDDATKRGKAAYPLALPPLVVAMERTRGLAPGAEADRLLVGLIHEYGLTHEMIPNEHKGSPTIWEALLEKMPMGAMVRNLAKMTRVGLISPLSAASAKVTAALGDEAAIRKARLHPLALLSALRVYGQGHGERSDASWEPVGAITDALDAAFYTAFGNVTPMNKGTLLALDVSGSMSDWCGMSPEDRKKTIPGLTPRDICAAMAMVTARVEPQAFAMAFSAGIVPFDLSKRRRLDDVIDGMKRLSFSSTDCALPMLWATQHKKHGIDTFVIYTDNETNMSSMHPYVALQQYRRQSGRQHAKLVVVGITPTPFTIADPNDAGMLDVVGFDTASPEILSSFARGEL